MKGILLEASGLFVSYGGKKALEDAGLMLEEGSMTMIIGPNGAGKSTLLKAVSGGVKPDSGEVSLLGKDLYTYSPKERARHLAMLSQTHPYSSSFTVRELVRLGRYPYSGGAFGKGDPEEDEKTERVLEAMGLEDLASRPLRTLSGGEAQRAFIAQLIAQEPEVMLLDEPVNNLDPQYQEQIFEMLSAWLSEGGRAVAAVVHDIAAARTYGDRIILMSSGRTIASGTPQEVMTGELLGTAYGMDVGRWMRKLHGSWETEL
jgi:iron complex transport system ATP-binding protein